MKTFKRLLVIALVLFVGIFTVKASTGLTIDDKAYDKNTQEFTVSGTSNYSEVMVSLFDGENLLSFRTVEANGNNYEATFNISFDEDKTITIKVGDIYSTDYEIDTLDVEKSAEPERISKLTDENGNSLTILDALKSFDAGDELDIQLIDDFDTLDEDDQAIFNAVKEKLGKKKSLAAAMIVNVINNGDPIELDETNKGYELFINTDKDSVTTFKNPRMLRILNLETLEFEDALNVTYDDDSQGIKLRINNIGVYLIYDDLTPVKTSSNPTTGDKIMTYVIIAIVCVLTLGIAGFYLFMI